MPIYDPKKVFASYGLIPLGDFAPGTYIEAVPNKDDFRTVGGSDGSVDFIKNIGITYTIKMLIMQTSQTNTFLSASRLADVTGNVGVLPLLLKDNSPNGTTVLFMPRARIIRPPSLNLADTTTPREWTFSGVSGEYVIGGN